MSDVEKLMYVADKMSDLIDQAMDTCDPETEEEWNDISMELQLVQAFLEGKS